MMIAVGGGKGSPGATFVAMNLATALAAAGDNVLLIDLDPHGGDVAAYLGLDPRSGLYPLMRLDGKQPSLEAILREAQPRDGVQCIAGFPHAKDADIEMIVSVIDAVSDSRFTVIADIGRVTPSTAELFARADSVLLAVRPELVGVFSAQRAAETLKAAGVDESRISAVVNCWEWRRSADLAETVAALKVNVVGSIPMDKKEVRRAHADQRPLQRGRAFKAFRSLAMEVRKTAAVERVSERV